MIDIIERIQELMDKKGWSYYELAAQTGISTNSVYDWFKKGAMPSMGNIVKVCNAMEISLERFFCGDSGYQMSEEEQTIMNEWFGLSEFEKQTIFMLIESFQVLKKST